MPFITIIAIVGIIAELVKLVVKNRTKSNTVSADEVTKCRNLISNMQTDLDEIKADLRTVVIQMDDFKLYKANPSVVEKKRLNDVANFSVPLEN